MVAARRSDDINLPRLDVGDLPHHAERKFSREHIFTGTQEGEKLMLVATAQRVETKKEGDEEMR